MPRPLPSTSALRRRSHLLPGAILASGFGLICSRAFVPGLTSVQTRSKLLIFDTIQNGKQYGVMAATALSMLGATSEAGSVVDSPLAHGAPGAFDDGVLQGVFEKCVFGGLLASTVFSWWRGTLGSGRAQSQELAGKPYGFWSLAFSCGSLVLLLSDRRYES